VQEAARTYELEPALLHAVISVESGYNPKAKSRKGASGLMQLMPDTARRYGVADIFDPAQNVRAGARYLRDLLRMFNNDMKLALAAYNAGENAVIRHGRIPPYQETVAYVPKVLAFYKKLGALKLDS
jgi:soluble lytic murein transglycosylase-like protein